MSHQAKGKNVGVVEPPPAGLGKLFELARSSHQLLLTEPAFEAPLFGVADRLTTGDLLLGGSDLLRRGLRFGLVLHAQTLTDGPKDEPLDHFPDQENDPGQSERVGQI